jgi:hypothetical protein
MTTATAPRKLSKNVGLIEMMLFVTCAKCWQQQNTDGSKCWMAQGTIHPFVQLEPSTGDSPGDALLNAYSHWEQLNASGR